MPQPKVRGVKLEDAGEHWQWWRMLVLVQCVGSIVGWNVWEVVKGVSSTGGGWQCQSLSALLDGVSSGVGC